MPVDLTAFSQDSAAAPALSALAEGKWRKARDEAKDLCKKDEARYLPLLIEANTGLAKDMMAKGLTKDAETVVIYLRTIAPKAMVDELAEALKKSFSTTPAKVAEKVGSGPALIATLWPIVLQVAADLEVKKVPSPADWSAIDAAVTCYAPAPDAEADALAEQVRQELAAVHKACDASAEGRWEEAQNALRKLPRQSVFQHWRLLLRGMRHVFLGEKDQAQTCFSTLPKDGACARAAAAIGGATLLPGTVKRAAGSARASWWLAVSGQPVEWAASIAEADAAWKGGDWATAYKALAQGLKNRFPSDVPSLPGLLTEVLFVIPPPHSDLEEKRFLNSEKFLGQMMRGSSLPGLLWKIVVRNMVFRDAPALSAAELRQEWLEIMRQDSNHHGSNAVRESLAWQWLGEQLTGPDPRSYDPEVHIRPPDFHAAEDAFKKAIQVDPANESAHLSLLGLLTIQNKTSERNKLLDDLVIKFPQNKAVMLQAGYLATERKAFGKALNFFRAARALDPLDKATRTGLIWCLVRQARDLAKKKKDHSALWAEMEPLLSDHRDPSELISQRWTQRIRRALLEADPQIKAAATADAARLAPSVFEHLALEHLLQSLYVLPLRTNLRKDWEALLEKEEVGWQHLQSVLNIMAILCEMPEWSRKDSFVASYLMSSLLPPVFRTSLTSDPEGLLNTLSQSSKLTEKAFVHLSQAITHLLSGTHQALKPLAKRKTMDPRLRLAHLRLTAASPGFLVNAPFRKKVAAVVDALLADGFVKWAEDARSLMNVISRPRYDSGYDDDYFDDKFEDTEPHDAESSLPSIIPSELREFVNAVLRGSKADIEKAKRAAVAAGIPVQLIDQLLAEAAKPNLDSEPNRKRPSSRGPQTELDLS